MGAAGGASSSPPHCLKFAVMHLAHVSKRVAAQSLCAIPLQAWHLTALMALF